VWIQEGRGVQLGEIAGEIVADRHGAIVSDLSEQARRAVLDLVLAEIEKQGVVAPFDEVAELVHDIIDEEDPLKLWFKSASLIAGRILEKLNLQKIL
jgi:hypothetical protein